MNYNEYCETGRQIYENLLKYVSRIIENNLSKTHSISKAVIIESRAKEPSSLKKKLELIQCSEEENITLKVKDLAGYRVVFKRLTDVEIFVNKTIRNCGFVIIDPKTHYFSNEKVDQETSCYTAEHLIITLDNNRNHPVEFLNLKCEIQVQTLLDYTYSSLTHDSIYKSNMSDIWKSKLQELNLFYTKLASDYLKPANLQIFQIQMKEIKLHKASTIEKLGIINTLENTKSIYEIVEVLQLLAEHIFPVLWKDKQYEKVDNDFLNVFSYLKGKFTKLDKYERKKVFEETSKFLIEMISLDTHLVFKNFIELYHITQNEKEQNLIIERIANVFSYMNSLTVCQFDTILSYLTKMNNLELIKNIDIILVICENLLQTEVLKHSYKTSDLKLNKLFEHNKYVEYSKSLTLLISTKNLRQNSINLLKKCFQLFCQNFFKKNQIIYIFLDAFNVLSPYSDIHNRLTNELIYESKNIIKFMKLVINNFCMAIQVEIERKLFDVYLWIDKRQMQTENTNFDLKLLNSVVIEIQSFKKKIDLNKKFRIFKDLVMPCSISDYQWQFKSSETNLSDLIQKDYKIIEYINSIDSDNEMFWYNLIIEFSNQLKENKLSYFAKSFLQRLALEKAEFTLKVFNANEVILEYAIPSIFSGLLKSLEKHSALKIIQCWINEGKYYDSILQISDLPYAYIKQIFIQGSKDKNFRILILLLDICNSRDNNKLSKLVIPIIQEFTKDKYSDWLSPIIRLKLQKIDVKGLDIILENLVFYSYGNHDSNSDYTFEDILSEIAAKLPEKILEFFIKRTKFENDNEHNNYYALPFFGFKFPDLTKSLGVLSTDHIVFNLIEVYKKYQSDSVILLLISVYPSWTEKLNDNLKDLLKMNNDLANSFVLKVVSKYLSLKNNNYIDVYDFIPNLIEISSSISYIEILDCVCATELGLTIGTFGRSNNYQDIIDIIKNWNIENTKTKTFSEMLIKDLINLKNSSLKNEERNLLRDLV